MTFPRRAGLFAATLALAWWLGPPARGTDPAAAATPAPAGAPVVVEKADGTKLTGTLAAPLLRLKAGFGAVELDVSKLKTIDLEDADGEVQATVTLRDKSHISGPLVDPVLVVDVAGKPVAVPAGQIRRVSFQWPVDHSLLAAVVGLVTLTLLEIVLGVDNIIFLAIVAGKLPEPQQPRARRIGLLAALGTRLLLLASLSLLLGLTKPLFTLPAMPLFETAEARGVSLRDLILLVGGAFLIGKSVWEMHEKLEHAKAEEAGTPVTKTASFAGVILQIAVIDIIFSLDSVITAVGMVEELWVMITAMVIAVGVMMVFSGPIARFVDRHPTVKVLALSFLILIGVLLVAEGLGQHMDKGYIYFAMAFAVAVEVVNQKLRGSPKKG